MDLSTLRNRMSNKSSHELLNIINNEKDDYTNDALKVIQEILEEREESIPSKKQKIINVNNIKVEKRYQSLRIISNFIKFLAYFAFLMIVLMSFSISDNIAISIAIIIISIITLISYLAYSEIIDLFTDLEENTRLTNKLLKKMIDNNH